MSGPEFVHATLGAGTTRFLTDPEKDREIASFAARREDKAHYRTAHPEARGGEGWIDPEVLPLVDALNAIPGVCTIQSCSGHARESYVTDGQLWLRLDESTTRAVDARIGELLAHDVIHRVTRQYAFHNGSEPHEFLDIRFTGERVADVQRVLVAFFLGAVERG